MKYMLDTNICIYIIKHKPNKVFERFESYRPGDICISSITSAELEDGVSKSLYKERNKFALIEFLTLIEVLPYTEKAASIYGEIRSTLEKKGQIIGGFDMLISSHALSENLTLVTNNISKFKRVNQLRTENWCE